MLTRELITDNHRRFVERVASSEAVWAIRVSNGFAHSVSNETDDSSAEDTPVLLFWSDRAYAARAARESYPDGAVESLSLFDFLFRWLPGMAGDRVLAGTNWTGDLVGIEIDPDELQKQLLEALGKERRAQYSSRLKHSLGSGPT